MNLVWMALIGAFVGSFVATFAALLLVNWMAWH